MISFVKRLFKIKEQKTSEEITILFKGTFGTELGKKTIEHLADVFIDREIYVAGMTLDQVAFRQGEASVVKKIIKEINSNGRFTITDDTK